MMSNKKFDILSVIKKRHTIRKYKDRRISKRLINKIIEAGIWGPSITFLQIQPWRFIVINNKGLKNRISELILKKSKIEGIGVNILLRSAVDIINSAPIIILVYNSGDIRKLEVKYTELYAKFSRLVPVAEISSISASIQNMILVAESLGIGSCWLDIPLLCEKDINKLLNMDENLVAVLTLGYPAQKGKRSKRKPRSETVMYFK